MLTTLIYRSHIRDDEPVKKIEEMVELYYNSAQFTHTLPVLEAVFPNPFRLYEELAAYYEKKGYFINNPARSYRYQVLLDFAFLWTRRGRAFTGSS